MSVPPRPIIQTQDLRIGPHTAGLASETALFQIAEWQLLPGQLVLVTGASGCGKSTWLKTIAWLQSPLSGTMWFENKPYPSYPPATLRRDLAYVSQYPTVFEGSVEDNLTWPHRIHNRPLPVQEQLHAGLTEVGLSQITDLQRSADSLSGGEKYRLCVARALQNKPKVLLLDEPTAALDSESTEHFLAGVLNTQLQQGACVIVSHQLQDFQDFSYEHFHIEAGQWHTQPPHGSLAPTKGGQSLESF